MEKPIAPKKRKAGVPPPKMRLTGPNPVISAKTDIAAVASKKKPVKDPKEIVCMEYGPGLLKWMKANPKRWGEFLTQKEMPRDADYGKTRTGGCNGFGKNIMEWPEDLIICGI